MAAVYIYASWSWIVSWEKDRFLAVQDKTCPRIEVFGFASAAIGHGRRCFVIYSMLVREDKKRGIQ